MNNKFLIAIFLLSPILGCATTSRIQASMNAPLVPDYSDDVKEVSKKLDTEGLIGLVHGANPERGLYVFEYNKPDDFFTRYYFSLLSRDHEAVKNLHRGDRIHVWGKLGGQDTPQPHLRASKIEVLQTYDPGVPTPGGHEGTPVQIPDELKDRKEIEVEVHAVIADGRVLVVEYKDVILPLVVNSPDNEYTRDLFRGDIVRIGFELQSHPSQPTHVVFKPRATRPYFDVIERLVDRHGKTFKGNGALTLFPKSPVINQDIWALEEDVGFGLHRYMTLVNFDKDSNGQMTEWAKLKAKLRAAWDAHPEGVVQGRNKFINRRVHIQVQGIANVVSPAQANAQLFLKADDITIL